MLRMSHALAVAAPALVALAVPAAAQENRETLPPGQARVLVETYAQCVVRLEPARVRAGIRAFLAGSDEKLPIIRDCVGNAAYSTAEMTFSHDVNRYALAEAIYAVDYGKGPLPALDAVPVTPPPPVASLDTAALPADARAAAEVRAAHDRAVAMRYMLAVGDCVVRTDAAAARALVVAPVESRTELTAIGAIQPVLAQCLPKGQTVHFNRTSLRGIVALSAYRLSDAATRGATAGGTAAKEHTGA